MRIATVGLVSLLLCAAPAVAGCAGSDGGTSSATATRTSPTSRTSSAGPARPGLAGRLLPASAVAGLNDGYRWREAGTGTGEPKRLFGTCQRFAVTSIGAERVAVRHYLPAGAAFRKAGDHAGELVAAFPDETTARRAFAVLRAWRGRCADRLPGHKSSDVGDLQDVAARGGTGGWYLLTYGPVKGDPGARYYDAEGIAVVGSRIALLSMVKVGEDYDYEPGHEPIVGTLRRAAGLLR